MWEVLGTNVLNSFAVWNAASQQNYFVDVLFSNLLPILFKREAIHVSLVDNSVPCRKFFPQMCGKCPYWLTIGSNLIKCNICKLLDYM